MRWSSCDSSIAMFSCCSSFPTPPNVSHDCPHSQLLLLLLLLSSEDDQDEGIVFLSASVNTSLQIPVFTCIIILSVWRHSLTCLLRVVIVSFLKFSLAMFTVVMPFLSALSCVW